MMGNRGQALQIGAVLLLGILVVLIAVWQATVIPDQNEQVEFEHNQQVQGEMVELRGELLSAADGSSPSSSSVQLGTDFPSRLLFVNPSDATGNLYTEEVGDGEIRIENAEPVDEDVAAFWDNEDFWDGEPTFETKSLRYSPDYRLFQGAPETVLDNTVVYNEFDNEGTTLATSQQSLINSDRISLIALAGDYFETGVGSESPDIEPVSTGGETIDIEPDEADQPIEIEIPTQLSVAEWEELVEGESDVEVNDGGEDSVVLELTGDEYKLNMAKLGIGPAVPSTDPAYMTEVAGGTTAVAGDDHTITVDVRDEFNVPQSGINVSVHRGPSDSDPSYLTTGPNGQVDYTFSPTLGTDYEIVFDATNYDNVENVSVDLTVNPRNQTDLDNPGGILGINPGPNLGLVYVEQSPEIEEDGEPVYGGGGDVDGVGLEFVNNHDEDMALRALRLSSYVVDNPSTQIAPTEITYEYDGDETSFPVPSGFKNDSNGLTGPVLDEGESTMVEFYFDDDAVTQTGDMMMVHGVWEEVNPSHEDEPVQQAESYFFAVGEAEQPDGDTDSESLEEKGYFSAIDDFHANREYQSRAVAETDDGTTYGGEWVEFET